MTSRHLLSTLFIAFAAAGACSDRTPPNAKPALAQKAATDKGADTAGPITVNGAGATFPYPIYAKWAHVYHQVSGTRLNYQSIGSGGGIAQIKAKTVDFGASDAPLEKADLDAEGLIQFPMVIGGVVPVVNLEGVAPGALKLSKALLADIFLGKVKKWSDDEIAELNPGAKLPDKDVVIVHRADGSGTTWIFTNYLDKISPEWHEKVGTGKAVKWPTGMGGKGNEGVAAYVQRVSGTIGYVELAYAMQNTMSHVLLENAEGEYVAPTIASLQAAAVGADWANAPGFYLVLTDQPGKESWPITGASFILVHKAQEDAALGAEMLRFFDFCYEKGAKQAEALNYVPIPDAVVSLVRDEWRREMMANGNPVWK